MADGNGYGYGIKSYGNYTVDSAGNRYVGGDDATSRMIRQYQSSQYAHERSSWARQMSEWNSSSNDLFRARQGLGKSTMEDAPWNRRRSFFEKLRSQSFADAYRAKGEREVILDIQKALREMRKRAGSAGQRAILDDEEFQTSFAKNADYAAGLLSGPPEGAGGGSKARRARREYEEKMRREMGDGPFNAVSQILMFGLVVALGTSDEQAGQAINAAFTAYDIGGVVELILGAFSEEAPWARAGERAIRGGLMRGGGMSVESRFASRAATGFRMRGIGGRGFTEVVASRARYARFARMAGRIARFIR